MDDTLLIRYGELALKSPPVRREFEGRLRQNLLESFARAGVSCTVSADHGHLYVHTADARAAVALVRRLFGVVSASPARSVPSNVEGIGKAVVELAGPHLSVGTRFAIRARRTGTHPFTSQELGAQVGGAILDAFPERQLKVDLTDPEVEFHVEVRGPITYLYIDKIPGPGGLPLGVAGKVGAHIDGVRGALGAYLLMKRGCRVFPVTSGEGEGLARDILLQYDPHLKPEPSQDRDKAWALLRERVASQRLDGVALPLEIEAYPEARAFWGDTVLFSPTVGLTDEEVESAWRDVVNLSR